MSALYLRLAYPLLLAFLIVWLAALVNFIWARGGVVFFRRHCVLLVGSLALTIGVFCLSPPAIGMLPDEGDHLSIARNLRHRGAPVVTAHALPDGHADDELSNRPLLFPVLVSVAHLAHETWRNGFVVNFFVLWALLALAGLVGRRLAGWPGAVAAPLLVLAVPAVTVWATSSGYDLLSLSLSSLFVVLAADHCASPRRASEAPRPSPSPNGARKGEALLWTTWMLVAQVRAENVVFCVLSAVVVIVAQRRMVAAFIVPGIVAALGLRALQLVLTRDQNLGGMLDASQFSPRILTGNLATLLRRLFWQFSDDHQAQPVNWLGVALMALLLSDLAAAVRRRRAVALLVAAAVATGAVAFGFAFGSLDFGFGSRFALPIALVLAAMPLVAHALRPLWISRRVLVAVAVVAALAAVPKIRTAHARGATWGARGFPAIHDLIGDEPRPKPVLILAHANTCSVFAAIGCSCQQVAWATSHGDGLLRLLDGADAYLSLVRDGDDLSPPQLHLRIAVDLVGDRSFRPGQRLLVWRLRR